MTMGEVKKEEQTKQQNDQHWARKQFGSTK